MVHRGLSSCFVCRVLLLRSSVACFIGRVGATAGWVVGVGMAWHSTSCSSARNFFLSHRIIQSKVTIGIRKMNSGGRK